MSIYEGSAVALVTPFIENTKEIDWRAFESLLDFHLENNTDALVITGTTGESSTLSDEEQIELIKFAVKHVEEKLPVIAGTGINDTRHAIKLSQQAEHVGADALLIVTPYYNKASYNGMLAHFRAIADSVNIPIILYDVPSRTGTSLTPEQVGILAEHPNIVALKDAVGNLDYTRAVLDNVPDDFAVYSGNDDLNYDIIALGGKGAISVTANILPKEVHDLCRLALDGHTEEAQQLNYKLEDINRDLFDEVNPIPVKYLVHKMNRCALSYRLPMVPPSEESAELLDTYLGLIEKYTI
ncbi:4-hydroxy-tetrahydrodipicolinate synthase [Ruoffia tabacinasalis]|uniref:4-hydroxy-tetrahydrodipicolinate synthase n=1 Tax=Ruoffia tabacinasalis TaxID=87458 RepID=A0ABS0LLI5_9LACT|nr:4-hydroxy-tetrahydrodipicolinate synthase [Ruoffia tabacinasalis]MBG9978299.1 4-hydroxy-tetrahydrodipicolinate synthase [Ruoffia tabacinasalis]